MGIRVGSIWRTAIRIRFWSVLWVGFAAPSHAGGHPASAAQLQAAQRVTAQFEPFAGSPQNARALVQGLRTGTEILLVSTAPARRVAFTPATSPMGYGNVAKALSIAQRELAARGIARPTPEELKAVLMGGPVRLGRREAARVVRYSGILPLRATQMRWGEIANALATSPVARCKRMASRGAAPGLAAL